MGGLATGMVGGAVIRTTPTGFTLIGESSFTVAIGSGTESKAIPLSLEGDIILIILASDNVVQVALDGVVGQSYTLIYEQTVGNPGSQLVYKLQPSTPDTTVDVTRSANSRVITGIIQVWRGVDQTTPIDATRTVANNTTGVPNPPSYTTVTDRALVFAVGFLDDEDEAGNVTAPSGYTNLLDNDTGAEVSDDLGATVMVSSKVVPTAGAENPAVYVISGADDRWTAVTFALRPA